MRRRIAKTVGYTVAPKLTFAAIHPKKAAFGKAAMWAMNRVKPKPRRRTPSHAAIGFGAAVVALPIGLWLGRRFRTGAATEM